MMETVIFIDGLIITGLNAHADLKGAEVGMTAKDVTQPDLIHM